MSEVATEPRIISWAAFWTLLGSVATLTLAALPPLLGMTGGWHQLAHLTVAGVMAWSASSLASRVVQTSLANLTPRARDQVQRWIRGAALVHWGWIAAWVLEPSAWFGWSLALTGMGVAEYWFARCHHHFIDASPDPAPGVPQKPASDHTSRVVACALAQAQLGWLDVLGWTPIGSGKPFGIRVDLDTRLVDGRKIPELTQADARPIAIALGKRLTETLETDWVQIEPQRGAGRYSLVVVTEDIMAKVRTYTDDPTPTTIRADALVGWKIDDTPMRMNLRRHGREVGQSTSGKSGFVHVKFAHYTRCTDVVLWACGVQKLYDFVADWIEPYEGTDYPLPIDWIAEGQEDTLAMLVAAMSIARWRQRQPMSRRGNWPTLIVELDESSFAFRNQAVTAVFDGQRVTASQMGAMIRQGAASAGVFLQDASQRSTNDHGGPQGADLQANAAYNVAFKTQDWQEIGRLMGNAYYGLPAPRHPGVAWIDTGDGPVQIKVPYLQEFDPNKKHLHDGLTIRDVAWARRQIRHELDPGSAGIAGQRYAERHTRMTDELHRYLTASPPVDAEMSTVSQAAYDEVMAAYGSSPVAGTPTSPVATLTEHRPLADRIVGIVAGADEPLTRAGIIAALHEVGAASGEQVVTNALTRLTKTEKLARLDSGGYVIGDAASTNTPARGVP